MTTPKTMMQKYHKMITPKAMTQMYHQMVPTNYKYKKDELPKQYNKTTNKKNNNMRLMMWQGNQQWLFEDELTRLHSTFDMYILK